MPWVSGKCLTRPRTCRIGSRPAGPGSDGSGLVGCGAVVTDDLLPEVAGAGAGLADPVERGLLDAADVPRQRAARVEGAARRDVQQVGRQALDRVQLLALLVQPRDRVEQALGVRVGGCPVDVVDR